LKLTSGLVGVGDGVGLGFAVGLGVAVWVGVGVAAEGEVGVATGATGVMGATGVELTTEEETLVPREFDAETLKKYEVPLFRPETVAVVVALVPSEKVTQVVPSIEYSIT
jgi:hypothetical protein